MRKILGWKLKKLIRIVNNIADFKINQGVLLKELAHSIQAHQKDKTVKEWSETILKVLNGMVGEEKEILK